MIASHYVEPLERAIRSASPLREAPADDAAEIRQLEPGEKFLMLENTVGWAWGYAGDDGRVGYVRSEAVD